ncbi:MAG TPA: gamma-glutamyltransferase [Vicinamibacterales bacterium]|jgi:gamma-glutamyltranspeptidase/glutathione hydrolase
MKVRLLLRWFVLASLLVCGCNRESATAAKAGPPAVPPAWSHPLTAPDVAAPHGVVVSDAPLASRVGADVLRAGGTAVDAAIATAFALAVTLPSAGNVGGGGFAVVSVNGQAAALDFRETAPAAATRNMYLDAQGAVTDRSVTGHLAAGVPGSVAGLWALHQKFGTKPWAELVNPAIALAERGFAVDADFSSAIGDEAKRLSKFPASAALFLPGGARPAEGSSWSDPDLAQVLKRIAAGGHDGFYKGETAALIVAEMKKGGGIITRDDLERYEPKWREPVAFTYRGRRVVSMPPPSSGGVTLAMIGQQLEPYDLAKLGWHSAAAIHVQAEAMRRAFAVRNDVLGDPDFVTFDAGRLSSKEFARELQSSISLDHATPSSQVSGRSGISHDGPHTTHFSVVDAAGNAVAMTTTINSGFGSAATVTGAGFLLNNEMDDFAAKPGSPNQYGLVQGDANAIAPGKRMLSAMTPTIVFGTDGKPAIVTGASGGPFIITTAWEIISNIVDYGMPASSAMSAPRFHHQHLPDEISLEQDGFDASVQQALKALGHRLTFFAVPTTGWTVAATIERRGDWHGMADPRLHGESAGY